MDTLPFTQRSWVFETVRATAAEWAGTGSYLLQQYQMGVETDTGKTKLGDGVTDWDSLPYWNPSGGSTGLPYDLACQVTGAPTADQVVLKFVAPRAFTLSASGQQGEADVAATAQTDFLVAVNGSTVATLRFAAAGTVASVVGGTEDAVGIGDIVTITAPNSPDGTLADIAFTLPGVI